MSILTLLSGYCALKATSPHVYTSSSYDAPSPSPKKPVESPLPTQEEMEVARKRYHERRCSHYFDSVNAMAPVAIRDTISSDQPHKYFDIERSAMTGPEKRACPEYGEFVKSMKKIGITVELSNTNSHVVSFLYYDINKNELRIL